jgi:hypothetical protein
VVHQSPKGIICPGPPYFTELAWVAPVILRRGESRQDLFAPFKLQLYIHKEIIYIIVNIIIISKIYLCSVTNVL